nr:FAD-dependent oxidoreductase [Desulfobacterales bacterium]
METQVLIIGGGVTGTGLARDLALRGIHSILVEKHDLNAGASGGNHGLLHSGARYIESDPSAAKECRIENQLLKRLAPQCIEDTGGFFVAVEGDDESYVADFPQRCTQAGIATKPVDVAEARHREPGLSRKVIAVYRVDDASIDPFRLTIDNIGHAQELGSQFLPNKQVVKFILKDKRINRILVVDTITGKENTIEVEYVVNAAGAWSGKIATLAGIPLQINYSKGSLLVSQQRITKRVINRLREASDGDIAVPGGTVSILGTTSQRIDSLRQARPTIAEVDHIIDEVAAMLPEVESVRYIRAYCGVRPLTSASSIGDDREVSRGFALIDHSTDG